MADDNVENRVYLFKDLAAAWIGANPGLLHQSRDDARRALGELARICAVVSGEDTDDADAMAAVIRGEAP